MNINITGAGGGLDVLTIHTKKCLANAVKSAVENWVDDPGTNGVRFRTMLAGTSSPTLLDIAVGYLDDELQSCVCRVGAWKSVQARYEDHGRSYAAITAESHFRCGYFSAEDYAQILGWLSKKPAHFCIVGMHNFDGTFYAYPRPEWYGTEDATDIACLSCVDSNGVVRVDADIRKFN